MTAALSFWLRKSATVYGFLSQTMQQAFFGGYSLFWNIESLLRKAIWPRAVLNGTACSKMHTLCGRVNIQQYWFSVNLTILKGSSDFVKGTLICAGNRKPAAAKGHIWRSQIGANLPVQTHSTLG